MLARAATFLQSIDPSLLNLIVLPTEKCNFRCTYCYEDFAKGKMPPKIVLGLKNLLKNRAPTLRRLHLSWFGGEPLLADDVVLEISEYAKDLSIEYGFELFGSITTNGWYLESLLMNSLLEASITNFQISLDGPKRHHDSSRITINNSGTYDRIFSNLRAARDSRGEYEIILRLHVTGENFDDLENWIEEEIKTYFGSDDRFKIFLKLVGRLGGANNDKIKILDDRSRLDNFKRLKSKYERKESGPPTEKICYASRGNSYVIRADGRLAKCTVKLNDPGNDVGFLSETGELIVETEKMRHWMRGLADPDGRTMACPAFAH
ncbi:MAG: radical SAM protein [Bauldia sp.]